MKLRIHTKDQSQEVTMKQTENYEQLLERFYKRTTQLEDRQTELEDAYQEYMQLDRDLDRLKDLFKL